MPGLRPTYRLIADGDVVSEGDLRLRRTRRGPAYGATIASVAPDAALRLEVAVLDVRPTPSDCDTAAATLAWDLAPADEPAATRSGPDGGAEDSADNHDFRLITSTDIRTPENYSDIWGWNNGEVFFALIGTDTGTSLVDITTPGVPIETAFAVGPESSWRDIKTLGNYIYIVTEGSGPNQGLQIINMTDPETPVLAPTYAATFTTAHNLWIDEDNAIAYVVGTTTGTHILDLSDPELPVEIGVWDDRYVHDAYVADGYAYFSEITDGIHEILDASDPANLTVLSTWETPGGNSHNSWPNDAQTILATTDEVTGGHTAVYDITSKTGPNPLLGEYDPDPTAIVHNVMFDDEDNETVGIAHYGLGAKYVDLHLPTAPVELASWDTEPNGDTGFIGAWGVYMNDPRGFMYFSDIASGLWIFEYDPSGGPLSGVIRDDTTGEPVEGAEVVTLAEGSSTTSGPTGSYGLLVDAGDVQIRVTRWGYFTQIVDGGQMTPGERVDLDVDLVSRPRTTLSGTVVDSSTLVGIAGAVVRVPEGGLETTTAADGSYLLTDIAVGQQTVKVTTFGYAGAVALIDFVDGVPASADFELDAGLFVDDVETDMGWTLGVPGDNADSGDWERVDPNGTGGGTVQPDEDHTPAPGVTAFITGQSAPGASIHDNAVKGGTTTLVSPVIDASGEETLQVRYWRWVSNIAGLLNGGRMTVEASSDGGATWSVVESLTANANQWVQSVRDLGSVVPLTDSVRIRFRASGTDGFPNYRVLEAGVDDFEIVRECAAPLNPAEPDTDGDGAVDVCDPCPTDPLDDPDGDGICGDVDNAPAVANLDQADADADGVGDVTDVCPGEFDPPQRDLDSDGIGDACDADIDGDGVPNDVDDDIDSDTVPNELDVCPSVPDLAQRDRDGDGVGDPCDDDDGHVHGVRVLDAGGSMTWEPESGSGSYNLYRGNLGAEALLQFATCLVSDVSVTWFADATRPPAGDGFFYLVAQVVAGVEGSLGSKSDGDPRAVTDTCP